MYKNVASQKAIFFAFDSTTNLPKTGDAANITAYVSKDFGSVTVLGDTSATEMDSTNAKGYYLFDLTQGETNADMLLFSAKSATSNIVVIGAPAAVFTDPPNFTLASIDSNGRLDIIKVAGTTQTAGDIMADTNDIQTRLPAALVGGRMDSSVGAVAAGAITAAAVADGTIDRATFAADTGLQSARSNTAQAGANGSITLDASASAVNDFYVGMWIYLTGATGVGQARVCTAYNGGTKVATIAPNWATNPDVTSTFAIMTSGQITGVQGSVTGSVASMTGNVTGSVGSIATGGIAAASFAAGAIDAAAIAANAIGASELADGAIDAATFAAGAITATVIATGAIDADALAADAVDEILDDTIGDGTITVRQALRVILAAVSGKLSGAATTTVTIRNVADSADVVVATVDADGNRTATTVTP